MDAIPEKQSGDAIIGQSRAMQTVYKAIGRVSQTDATILIQGESGTGKELVSRAVYQHSTRSHKQFLIINGDSPQPANEVAALEQSTHGLLKYTEQVHQDLKKSQETLLQSEKWPCWENLPPAQPTVSGTY